MKKVLYLGLDPVRYQQKYPQKQLVHHPLIEIQEEAIALAEQCDLALFNTLIVTSPRAADLLIKQQIVKFPLEIISVGQGTTKRFLSQGVPVTFTALRECQEGIISYLEKLSSQEARIFYPRSSSARPLIADYLNKRGFFYQVIDLYHVKPIQPEKLLNLGAFEEVVFTSPSTVTSFFCAYPTLPSHLQVTCTGHVTQQALAKAQKNKIFFHKSISNPHQELSRR